MPIYEYRCSSCGLEHEALQKFSDAPLVKCPACGAETLVKQLSAAGFQLKGSGWYVTDFRGGGGKSGKTETGTAPESTKGAETSATGDAKESKSESSTAASDSKSDTATSTTPPAKSGTPTTTP